MRKPEIEVVRFGAEDVIATSGAGRSLHVDGYVTRGKEIKQMGVDNIDGIGSIDGNAFYYFYNNSSSGPSDWAVYNSETHSSYNYAWYNDTYDSWGTDFKRFTEYTDGKYPEGIDN